MKEQLNKFLNNFEPLEDGIFLDRKNDKGYWSNLSKSENSIIIDELKNSSPEDTISKLRPDLYKVIFSSQRAAAVELLSLKGNETVVDLGCMWGGLTIPLAKQTGQVLGIDQTKESIIFTSKRAKKENLNNVSLLNTNLREIKLPKIFDVAIINGVLEWIPETNEVDLTKYFFSKSSIQKNKKSPKDIQYDFLNKIHNSLNDNGKLFLAIENRYDYKYFLGVKDPHAQTLFTTILPKKIVSIYFKIFKKREYKTWIYSFDETKKIIENAGFKNVKVYSAWPDYHFPDQIFEYGHLDNSFVLPTIRRAGKIKFKLLVKRFFETLLFKVFKKDFFAPAIIIIAKK